LDRYDNLNENSKREYDEVDNDDDSESEWTKPSAHEKLLSIFRKNKSKHLKKFYKREKLEQEGIELSEMKHSEDEKEIEEPLGIFYFICFVKVKYLNINILISVLISIFYSTIFNFYIR